MMNRKPVMVSKYLCNTIVRFATEIINGRLERVVYFIGYGYPSEDECEKKYKFLEYVHYCGLLKDVILEGFTEYEEEFNSGANYITDCSEEELIDMYEHYDNGNIPSIIKENSITEDVKDGMYIVKMSPLEKQSFEN